MGTFMISILVCVHVCVPASDLGSFIYLNTKLAKNTTINVLRLQKLCKFHNQFGLTYENTQRNPPVVQTK